MTKQKDREDIEKATREFYKRGRKIVELEDDHSEIKSLRESAFRLLFRFPLEGKAESKKDKIPMSTKNYKTLHRRNHRKQIGRI